MHSFIMFIATLLAFVDSGLSITLHHDLNILNAGNVNFDYVIVGGDTAGLTIAARPADWRFQVAVYEVKHPAARVLGSCSLGAGAEFRITTPNRLRLCGSLSTWCEFPRYSLPKRQVSRWIVCIKLNDISEVSLLVQTCTQY
ncbi:Glucose-methanol-choline oxidoreductase [Penicillium antarcticum]|uniref:Glucose-methanol-choline oxidoreductase n=1 Tax=Penicillium antarcticum TaxID=416450 RepID=UPI0023954A89|nr:Glucose-methanol-choline oxidoreductase [Penicillium antarcticum]KAJ5307047.1 Glucose-methanol-choline oxidoreductase [Penicillium antarcticum]